MLGLAEIPVDGLGNGGELVHFLVLSYEAFDHPDAVDILLDHGIQPVIGFEHPVEDVEDQGHDAQQHHRQNGDGHKVNRAELGTDAQRGHHGEDQHHGAADSHTDAHLEGHLQVCHIGGQPGHDGSGGELVDVGEAEVLHLVIHIMAQVPGEACSRFGGVGGG